MKNIMYRIPLSLKPLWMMVRIKVVGELQTIIQQTLTDTWGFSYLLRWVK